jgi:hypothetical protein
MPHYALIDCAADPALYPMILREGAYKCLFGGAVSPDLISAAPHIVELQQGSALHTALMGEGWYRNWGIVCASEANLWDVRKAVRGNLQATLPDGKVVLFRFYDPRVFAPFIEACTPAEAAEWFTTVTDYWVATQEGTVHYGFGAQGVQRSLLAPAAAG